MALSVVNNDNNEAIIMHILNIKLSILVYCIIRGIFASNSAFAAIFTGCDSNCDTYEKFKINNQQAKK